MTTDYTTAPLFSPAEMRPLFGGRVLRPGFKTTGEPMPLFAPAIEAERERVAALEPADQMRERGEAPLPTEHGGQP